MARKSRGDGCHPDCETWIDIENAGFKDVSYQHFLGEQRSFDC